MRKEAAQEWRINMRNRFDRQLVQLNDELIEMGGMIEKAIADTVKALVNQDTELAKVVIDYDEEIDHQEREIEQLCLKLLLQQQPVARDLRLISSALKMITDMERIGDQASDIAELSLQLGDVSDIDEYSNGEIAISFVGKDNISDYVVIEATADNFNTKFTIHNSDNRSSVIVDAKNGNEYMKMKLDCSLSGSNVNINEMSIDMNIEDVKANMKITGDYSQKEFSTMKYSSSSFPKPVNVDKMTSAQQTALATELVKNSAVFKKIISDDLYKQLFSVALSGN